MVKITKYPVLRGELKLLQRLHELSGTDVDIYPDYDSHLFDPYFFLMNITNK